MDVSTSSASSEIDSDDDDFMVAYIALECMGSTCKKKSEIPMTIPTLTGIQWVEITLQNPIECYNVFRMRRSVFLYLHDTLVQNYGLKASRGMCTKEALAMFLWACGAPQSFRQVKNRFSHSLETISRKFTEVLNSAMQLAFHIVRPTDPHFGYVHPKLQEARFWPHFKYCIGAIDGTHIPVTVTLHEQPKYIGRHGYPSQNVMAVCNFDMMFTFVVTGWPGSVHDSRVLSDTVVTWKQQFPHPPEGMYLLDTYYFSNDRYEVLTNLQIQNVGKYYLVDLGYSNKKGYLAPYKGQRYHVSEWQHGRTPVGLKEVFNHAHSSLRNVIERTFGVLKMKWHILLKMPKYKVKKQ
jgi:hypothetical protein